MRNSANLIEPMPYKKERNLKIWLSITIISFLILCLILASITTIKFLAYRKSKNEIIAAQEALKPYETALQEKIELEKEIESIQKKLNKIEKIKKNQKKPIELIDTLTTILPDDLRLTSFELKKEEIVLSGQSLSMQTLMKFLGEIKNLGEFNEVKLDSLKTSHVFENQEAVSFIIICTR